MQGRDEDGSQIPGTRHASRVDAILHLVCKHARPFQAAGEDIQGFPGCEHRAARTKRGAAEQANVYRCLTPKFLDARLVTVLVGHHGGEAGQNEVERRPSGGPGEDSAGRFSRHQVARQLAKTPVNAALEDTRAQVNPFGVASHRHAGVVEVVIEQILSDFKQQTGVVRESENWTEDYDLRIFF